MADLIYCEHCLNMLGSEPLADRGWPERSLRWHLSGGVPGITLEALARVVTMACHAWTKHCRLELTRTLDATDAHIRMRVGQIDGPRGILGQSQLPPTRPVNQLYDSAEDWVEGVSPLAVVTHELGHALGLQHDGSPGALMSAYYDPKILAPTERDTLRIVGLYGIRPPTPPPPADPSEDATDVMVILGKSGKEKIRYRLDWIPSPKPVEDAV